MNTVFVKTYAAPPVDLREVLRYAGVRGESPEMIVLANDCYSEAADALDFRVCYAELAVTRLGERSLDLEFAEVYSTSLAGLLSGCERAVVFAATVGLGFDRLIAKTGAMTPSRALMLDAVGAERIEALCDAFCAELAEEYAAQGYMTTRRFSPGYGDVPLALQRDIVRVLDTSRKIGVALNESLLMSPSKSVTAIVGLAKNS